MAERRHKLWAVKVAGDGVIEPHNSQQGISASGQPDPKSNEAESNLHYFKVPSHGNGKTEPLSAVLTEAVERVCTATGADGAVIALADHRDVICRASIGTAPVIGSSLKPYSGLTRECLETGKIVVCEDAEHDPRVRVSVAKSLDLRSAALAPIVAPGTVLGVVEVFSSRISAFHSTQVSELLRTALFLAPVVASESQKHPTVEPKGRAWLAVVACGLAVVVLLLGLAELRLHPAKSSLRTVPTRTIAKVGRADNSGGNKEPAGLITPRSETIEGSSVSVLSPSRSIPVLKSPTSAPLSAHEPPVSGTTAESRNSSATNSSSPVLEGAAPKESRGSAPLRLPNEGEIWVRNTLRSLSLEEKVGQLFMIRMRVDWLADESPEYMRLRDSIRRYHVGSLAMSVPAIGHFRQGNNRYETVALLNRLQKEANLPLLIAGDFERGVLPPRLFGTTVFPHAMAFGAAENPKYAEEFGRITAQESRALGVHWNLFPVADVNSNPANPIIGTRAFGDNPSQVGDLVAAYIRGAHAKGMLTTAKHFPGHGNTTTDSHIAIARVDEDFDRLSAVDLPPFRKAISAGVDAVMSAHIRVPALDPDPNHVATTSPHIIHDLLKTQLGFSGLVVTDALDMAGLSNRYKTNPGRAAVDAFKAGNDVLTMPADLGASFKAMLDAVHSGEIPQERLDASVLKILKAKGSLGLQKDRFVDVAAIPKLVGSPENVAEGQHISDESITLVRDNGTLLPLRSKRTDEHLLILYQRVKPSPPVLVILCDHLRAEDGHVLEREVRERIPDASVIYVDTRVAAARYESVLRAVAAAPQVIVAVYAVPSAARTRTVARGQKNTASLPDSTANLLHSILSRAAAKTAVLAMGTPYLTDNFPAIQNYICTFSNATVSEVSAARALFGEIRFSGHLPVNIRSPSLPSAENRPPGSWYPVGSHR
jgi:beta-N-acetylhexosaminidase